MNSNSKTFKLLSTSEPNLVVRHQSFVSEGLGDGNSLPDTFVYLHFSAASRVVGKNPV